MSFAESNLLWLLLVLPPALIVFFWYSWRLRRELMTRFIQSRLLPGLLAGLSTPRRNIRAACLILAVTALILTLARPQWGYVRQEIVQRGLDIVVAIDTSKSMLAEDITPNRLERARLAALDLLQQARSDRLGLVAFAGSAFLQCPLTFDDAVFRQSLQALDVNTIPQGGTALSAAIRQALTAFKEGDNYKVLVLFTDGEDHDSGALEEAKKAAGAGLRIFTIGIGSTEGELLRIKNQGGQLDYVRDENGNVVKSRLNEPLLQQIAGAASGFYLPLRGARTIDTLYQNGLAPLPKSDSQEKWVKRPIERYYWPLALGVLLLAVEMLLPERKSGARAVGQAPGNTVRSAAILLAVICLFPGLSAASPSSALRDYNAGKYAQALTEYERLLKENGADFRLRFNAGDAAYQTTNYATAIRHFTATLPSPDLKLQQAAYFNLGNTHYHLGEQSRTLDELQATWTKAAQCFQNAVELDKSDADALHNLSFVNGQLAMLVQLREAARKAKEAADAATRRRHYHEALQIMERQRDNIAAKPFEDFTKRLKDIDAIATPDP